MKIIVAMENVKLYEAICNQFQGSVYDHDISYMEGVIEYLCNYTKKEDSPLVITKDTLNGSLTRHTYIKQMKLANPNVRIIMFVKHLDNEYKEFLFANEVFNIIEAESVDIGYLKNVILNNKVTVYKYVESKDDSLKNKVCENGAIYPSTKIVTKQVISVFGTSGAGKTYISNMLIKNLALKLNLKACFLDMDILNPASDILNDIDNNKCNLLNLVEDIDKDKMSNSISDYMYTSKRLSNVSYLTNNSSIYDCQNKLCTSHYNKIYDRCLKEFDLVMIDLPASPFLDVVKYSLQTSDKILFVVNPNYISIRQAIKYLELITNLWGVAKSRIYLVINKVKKNSLESIQIENLLNEYNCVLNVIYDEEIEGYLNGATNKINEKIDIKKVLDIIGIDIQKEKSDIKSSVLANIFLRKRKEVLNGN